MRARALVAVLLLSGCGYSARAGDSQVANKRLHRIDCYDTPSCHERAKAICRTGVQVVEVWENPIPDSYLPGFNEDSNPTGIVGPSRPYPMRPERYEPLVRTGPGFESTDPLPFTELTFACAGG